MSLVSVNRGLGWHKEVSGSQKKGLGSGCHKQGLGVISRVWCRKKRSGRHMNGSRTLGVTSRGLAGVRGPHADRHNKGLSNESQSNRRSHKGTKIK